MATPSHRVPASSPDPLGEWSSRTPGESLVVRHEKDSILGDDEDDTTSSPAGHDKEREDLNAPFLSEKIVTSRLVAVEDNDMHTTGDRIPSAMGANSSPLSDEPTSAHANSAIPYEYTRSSTPTTGPSALRTDACDMIASGQMMSPTGIGKTAEEELAILQVAPNESVESPEKPFPNGSLPSDDELVANATTAAISSKVDQSSSPVIGDGDVNMDQQTSSPGSPVAAVEGRENHALLEGGMDIQMSPVVDLDQRTVPTQVLVPPTPTLPLIDMVKSSPARSLDDSQSPGLDAELLDLLDNTNGSLPKRRKLSHDSIHTFSNATPTFSETATPQPEFAAAPPPQKKSKPVTEGRSRIRSSRAEMSRLENARYNEKGEIIEDTPEDMVPSAPSVSSMSARADHPSDTSSFQPDLANGVGSSQGPAPPLYNISRAEAKLLNARYNEKGEMLAEMPVELKHDPKKKSNKKGITGSDQLGGFDEEAGDKAVLASASKPRTKGKSKSKATAEAGLDADVMALLDMPTGGKKPKKKKIVDEASSDRSGSVFTLAELRQETPTVVAKKPGKSAKESSPPEAGADSPMEHDDRLYCTCKKPYNEDTDDVMLECDRCFNWYHLGCVGVSEDDVELLDTYICKDCEKDTEQRTTWKVKCKREGCRKGRDEPISKYCTEACGIQHVLSVINSRNLENDQVWPAVKGALPPQGFSIHLDGPGLVSNLKHATAGGRKARISALKQDLDAFQSRLIDVDGRILSQDSAKRRLDSAIEVYEALPPIPRVADPESALKKQKKNKPTAAPGTTLDKLCAFDFRLIDEDEVNEGDVDMSTAEDINSFLCQTVERKCRRHVDWQNNRDADIQLYRSILTREKDSLLVMIRQNKEQLSKLDFRSTADSGSPEHVDVVMTLT